MASHEGEGEVTLRTLLMCVPIKVEMWMLN